MITQEMKEEFYILKKKILELQYDHLNEEQRKAVLSIKGPLLILAGAGSGKTTVLVNRVAHIIKYGESYEDDSAPGSLTEEDLQLMRDYISNDSMGKTRVLTYRIAYLIENGTYPGSILAITFTNKAAKEMKERVAAIIGSEANKMWISTFHSTCVRILRQDIEKIGFNKNFVIYDTQDQEKVIKECLKELNIDEKVFPPKGVLSKIGSQKDKLIDADTFYKKNANDYQNRKIAELYELYQKKLRMNNALDFDDIIMNTIKLFRENQDVVSYYQRKFRYILVDEYQDTNGAQYELVNMLARAHGNLCVVGDDDQSIYGWRGADISNILDFEDDYPNVKTIKLEQNYRCTKKILDAANFVIANNEQRKQKTLWTENGLGEDIRLFRAETDREESTFIVNEIEKLVEEGCSYRDFAILYRTNAMSRILEEGFVKSKVPYKVVGGLKFYDRKEVKDIMSYLKFINNTADSISLDRIINVPRRGIGDTTIDKIKLHGLENEQGLYMSMLEVEFVEGLTKRAVASIQKFIELMDEFIKVRDELKVSELIKELIDKTGYTKELLEEDTIESQSRIENLHELYSAAVEFEETAEDKSLSAFLERVALVSDQDSLNENGGVVLMTLHTAKGLEFPVVFIAGMEEGIFPHASYKDDENELEEERRLCYVGITRAKKQLYITCARQRLMFGRTTFNPVSSFVEEIPEDLITDVSKKNESSFSRVYGYESSGYKPNARINHGAEMPIINKPANTVSTGEIKAGVKVKHKVFGKGLVIAVQDSGGDKQVTIHFDTAGLKKLLLSVAPIEIL